MAAALSLLAVLLSPLRARAEEPSSRIAEPHRVLTSEEKWLNTSRKLEAQDLAGRILLVDFWTYCCINCMHIIPDLQEIEHRFDGKVTVIGVHSAKFANEKDSENIRAAVLRYGIEHPVVNDAKFRIWNGFGVDAWPTLILIGQDGAVKRAYSGEGNKDRIEKDIGELIAKGDYRTDRLPIALEKEKVAPGLLDYPGKLETGEYRGEKVLFIANSSKNEILAANAKGNILAHFSGGFNKPQGLLYDAGKLYVADTGNHRLKVIDLATGKTATLAGTGERGTGDRPEGDPLKTALSSPWDLAFYPDHGHIAIANAGSHQIWSYDIGGRSLKILAGNGREFIDDGKYPANSLSQTSGLSAVGGKLYFVDSETSSLRLLEDGNVTTLIGSGLFDFGYKEGKRGTARLQHPLGLSATKDKIYIADSYNHSIRIYDPATGQLKNFLGDGKRGELNEPNDIVEFNGALYIADTNNNDILKYENGKLVKFALNDAVALSDVRPEEAKELPNLMASGSNQVSGKATVLKITLKPGWHINEEAPTRLRLFQDHKRVKEFDKDALSKQPTRLGPLKPGRYLLQGTVYYCEEKTGSQCRIGSVNREIEVSEKATTDEIDLSF